MTTFRYFSYSSPGGFDFHKSLEQAKAAAADSLYYERESAGDSGWEVSDVLSICYGEIKGQVVETVLSLWTWDRRFDEFVDYDLKETPCP